MTVQDWFEKRKQAQIQRRQLEGRVELDMDPDLWTKCVHCDAQLLKEDLIKNDMVCPVCDYHFRINARTRIKQLFKKLTFSQYLLMKILLKSFLRKLSRQILLNLLIRKVIRTD